MGFYVGLWLDHEKAVIVTVADGVKENVLTIAGEGKQLRRKGDLPMTGGFESQKVPADDRQLRTYTAHLNRYYNSVIAGIDKADSILIFGPGEAKGELKKHIEKKKLGKRIAKIETADKMTKPQIVSKVRKYFKVNN